MKINTTIFGIVILGILILSGCAQQNTPTATSQSQPTIQSDLPKQECKVEDRGTGYMCFDAKENWAWKGKICDTFRGYIITESVSCIDNRCKKDETIIKNCKDYGVDWICGYRTGQEAHDTICAKPDWSEIKDV